MQTKKLKKMHDLIFCTGTICAVCRQGSVSAAAMQGSLATDFGAAPLAETRVVGATISPDVWPLMHSSLASRPARDV